MQSTNSEYGSPYLAVYHVTFFCHLPFSIHSAFQNMQAAHTVCTYAPHTIRNAGFWTERWWHAGRSPSSLARWQARRQRGPGDFAPPRTSLDFYNAMANQRCLGWNPRTHRFLSSAEFYHARNFIKKKFYCVVTFIG